MKRSALLALSLIVVSACTPAEEITRLAPALRLVNAEFGGAVSVEGPATAMIDDEQRHVLATHPKHVIVSEPLVEGRFEARSVKLPPPLDALAEVVASSRLDPPWGNVRYLPWQRLPVNDGAVDIQPALPAVGGAPRRLVVEVFTPPASHVVTHESEAVPIPTAASLEFGMGLMGQFGLPVWFEIEACISDECSSIFRERINRTDRWVDRTISLEALADQTVRFRFTAATENKRLFALPVWSNPTVVASLPGDPRAPNLILISLDTLRADHLSVYGYPHATSPYLEEFAREGVVFDSLVSAASTTPPSHMTMFTSLPPSAHGALVSGRNERLPTSVITLAQALRNRGFMTAAYTENGPLSAARGFARGFDVFKENKSTHLLLPNGQADTTFAEGLDWLRDIGDRRFFLFLHTFQTHFPYAPPPEYQAFFPEVAAQELPEGLPPTRGFALYDREIRYTDELVKSLNEQLAALGLDQNTFVVITSDHGDAFLEHGFLGHGSTVYSEIHHVPFLMRGPGLARGLRVEEVVGHIDFLPTFLDLLGVDVATQALGRSVADLARGRETSEAMRDRPAYTEAWTTPGVGPDLVRIEMEPPTLGVRLANRHLVRVRDAAGLRYELYDVVEDPLEANDLYAPGEAEDLVDLLERYEATAQELKVELDRSRLPDQPLDAEREQKLRALGYID